MTIHAAPLDEISTDVRTDQYHLQEYLAEVFGRIDAVEPTVKSLVSEPNRRERLEAEAAELLERHPDPDERPPLFGVPVAVKDIFHVDGLPTKANSDVPPGVLAGAEADAVTALREAGGLMLGKAVTTEFACFEPGPTRNPHDTSHTPGGSSSGSAAAVAAGITPLALGSQTGGSTLRPAAYCGVVGYKPTHDRISTDGMLPLSASADHVGVMTQDVTGMRLAASLLCRDWDEDVTPDPPVLGVPEGPYLTQATEEGLVCFEAQLERLADAGYDVRRVPMLDDVEVLNECHHDLLRGEIALSEHHHWFQSYEDSYSAVMADMVREGRDLRVEALAVARERGVDLQDEITETMAEAGVDVLVSPAAPGPAPEGLESTGSHVMNLPWTYAGIPAVTVPAGHADNGLPLGFQCATTAMDDEKLLAWSEPLASALDGMSTAA